MLDTQATFVFLARKIQYKAAESGQNVVVLAAQHFKKFRVEHGTAVVLVNATSGRRACASLQNAAEYGLEYSFLKSPKVCASEELIRSLGADSNNTTDIRLLTLGEVPVARTLTLSYAEHFDPRTGEWKSFGASVDKHDAEQNADTTVGDTGRPGYLDWCAQPTGNQVAYPPSKWWCNLLGGDMNNIVLSSLCGAVLAYGNLVALNVKGVLARFTVAHLAIGEVTSANDHLGRVGQNTSIHMKVKNGTTSISQINRNRRSVIKLGGLKEPLDILRRQVIQPLVYAEKYSSLGIQPPTGVILHGPPGCGKTMIGKALREGTKELFGMPEDVDVHIKLVQSSDLISSLLGRTEENICAMFEECAELARTKPCICVVDEIDVLCRKRDGSTEFNARNVTAFLNNMDGLTTHRNHDDRRKGYVIIGTTNDVDSIDLALRRPGRFDLEIEVGVPTSKDRLDILRIMMEEVRHNLTEEQLIYVNDYCQAFVGADLKQLVTNASWARLNSADATDKKNDGDDESHITFEDFKAALRITRPSALRELQVNVTDVRWEDIGGYEDVKLTLKECVEYPRTYSDAYEKMRVQTPRGLLLYGPPGCSKTLMAKAVATESHMNFISVKGPELFSKWVGESERAIRQLFRKARTNAPCVIFFDEMDSISVSREMSDAGGVGSRVLSQLLNEMDGINSIKQVLVIGATNRPDLMDGALLRPGRLDRLVYIPLPDIEARRSIFKIYLARLPTDGFDITAASGELAESTAGYSGAEIALVCKDAALAALREYIKRDKELRETAATGQHQRESNAETLLGAFDRLSVRDIVPVSRSHLREALARTKPRTNAQTIRFYEDYRAKHPF